MELNTIVSEVGTLVDIRDVSVNKELSRDERIAEFVQQIKNPYHFKCGRFTVQASFSAEGATLEECTEKYGSKCENSNAAASSICRRFLI